MAIKVLAVDDDICMLSIINKVLSKEGHTVTVFSDVDSAYEGVIANKPDLILLDLHVPCKSDAMEFIRRLKDSPKYNHIPVVYVTGEDAPKEVCDCFLSGGFDYLHKPFSATDLVEKVEYVGSLGKAGNRLTDYLDKFYAE